MVDYEPRDIRHLFLSEIFRTLCAWLLMHKAERCTACCSTESFGSSGLTSSTLIPTRQRLKQEVGKKLLSNSDGQWSSKRGFRPCSLRRGGAIGWREGLQRSRVQPLSPHQLHRNISEFPYTCGFVRLGLAFSNAISCFHTVLFVKLGLVFSIAIFVNVRIEEFGSF